MSYSEKLVGLIDFIKSGNPGAERIIDTLKSGDEDRIRNMLGNLDRWVEEYEYETPVRLSWTKDEIDDATRTARTIKPAPGGRTLSFWAW